MSFYSSPMSQQVIPTGATVIILWKCSLSCAATPSLSVGARSLAIKTIKTNRSTGSDFSFFFLLSILSFLFTCLLVLSHPIILFRKSESVASKTTRKATRDRRRRETESSITTPHTFLAGAEKQKTDESPICLVSAMEMKAKIDHAISNPLQFEYEARSMPTALTNAINFNDVLVEPSTNGWYRLFLQSAIIMIDFPGLLFS